MKKEVKSLSYVMLVFFTTMYALVFVGVSLSVLVVWTMNGQHHFNAPDTHIALFDGYFFRPSFALLVLLITTAGTIFNAYSCEYIRRNDSYNIYFLSAILVLTGIIPLLPIYIVYLNKIIKNNPISKVAK